MTNKWFSVLVTGLATTSLVACGAAPKKEATKPVEKKDTTTDTKTTTIVKGEVTKGTFKLGAVGSDLGAASTIGANITSDPTLKGKDIDDIVAKFTQDIKVPATVGSEYLNLPPGVDLKSYKAGDYTKAGFRVSTKTGADDAGKRKIFVDMQKKKLDALFVQVKNGIHNSSDAYKSIVEKKEFADTNLVMVGEKAKSQSGSSSKVFAGGKVSTASYNKYVAAYAAGFQSAVAALNYSKEEKTFEETAVSFFIGSVNDSTSKKKAFAFRRGVEAAASNSTYSAFLKVKFVSKTADSKSTGKRLYYDVSDWKNDDKIAEFTGSDDFTDSDYRVMYIAGTTAKDWRGTAATKKTGTSTAFSTSWKTGDDDGLIGAMAKYGTLPAAAAAVSGKSFTKTALVLDYLKATTNVDKTEYNQSAYDANHSPFGMIDGDGDNILDSGEMTTIIERDGIKLLGAIGGEIQGTRAFTQAAIKGLFLGGSTYMLGKHTAFGAGISVHSPNPFARALADYSLTDEDTKAKDHFDEALDHVFSKQLSESALIASSPWMK